MGIVQRQATQISAIILAGLAVGVVSRLLLPIAFSKGEIGAISLIDSISGLFASFFAFGFVQISNRVYPLLPDTDTEKRSFLWLGLKISLVGSLVGIGLYFLTRPLFLGEEGKIEPLLSISWLIAVVLVLKIFYRNLDAFFRMSFRSVVGTFLESFLIKFLMFVGVLLVWRDVLKFDGFIPIYILALGLPGVIMLILGLRSGFKGKQGESVLEKPEIRKAVWRNGIYGFITSGAGVLVLSVDQIMILNFTEQLEDVGAYSVLFFAGMLVNIPARGIKRIGSAVVGKAWKENNTEELQSIYTKSHLANFVMGSMLFLAGWSCIDDVLFYLPKYQYAMYVFLFVGLGQLVEISTGVNQEIIASSKKFEYNTYLTVVLGILICITNAIFIPSHGIIGAAFASFISILTVNILRLILVWKLFRLTPFSFSTIRALAVCLPFVILSVWDPLSFSRPLNIACYAFAYFAVLPMLLYRFNISEDLNSLIDKILRRIGLKANTPA